MTIKEKHLMQSSKNITKLAIDDTIYFRILHFVGQVITHVSVLELGQDPIDAEQVTITEVYVEEADEQLKQKIFSEQYAVELTESDQEIVLAAMQTQFNYFKSIAEKKINVGFNRKLLQFIEVGGLHYGYVFENNMPFTKLYHLVIDYVNEEVLVEGVEAAMLPAVIEAVGQTILASSDGIIVQIGEGVYVRIQKIVKGDGVATVTVVTSDEDGEETVLKVAMAFLLQYKNESDLWKVNLNQNHLRHSSIQKEIEESFNMIHMQLLLSLTESIGPAALDDLKDKKGTE